MKQQCIVATAGCFDVLHAGHIDLLKQCKGLGDQLIVLLNSDDSIKRLKGQHRPVNPFIYRKAVLEELRSVDHVCPFHQDTPCEILQVLKPNIYAKGSDYKKEQIPEEGLVRSYGGIIVYLERHFEMSSTTILDQMGYSHQ